MIIRVLLKIALKQLLEGEDNQNLENVLRKRENKLLRQIIINQTKYLDKLIEKKLINCKYIKITERIYHIMNDFYGRPICLLNGCYSFVRFKTYGEGYCDYCDNRKHCELNTREARKQTCLDVWGFEYVSQNSSVAAKIGIKSHNRKHTKEELIKMRDSNRGVSYLGACDYDFWAPKLLEANPGYIGKIRRDQDNISILQVQCENEKCGKWYSPTTNAVSLRIKVLECGYGGNNFLCSNLCKLQCPTYKKKKFAEGTNPNVEIDNSLRLAWANLVIKNQGLFCHLCNRKKGKFHVHHLDTCFCNPIESADIDNGIVLCSECHKKLHKILGYKYNLYQLEQYFIKWYNTNLLILK